MCKTVQYTALVQEVEYCSVSPHLGKASRREILHFFPTQERGGGCGLKYVDNMLFQIYCHEFDCLS